MCMYVYMYLSLSLYIYIYICIYGVGHQPDADAPRAADIGHNAGHVIFPRAGYSSKGGAVGGGCSGLG